MATKKLKSGNNYRADEKFATTEAGDYVGNSMLLYGKEVNTDRAIPKLEDGLKPAQRYALYVSFLDKLFPNKPYVKMTRVVGDAMAQFYVHGDGSLMASIYTMMRDWVLNVPLMDTEGNKGSQSGDTPAAARYLEVRLSEGGALMLKDLEKRITKFGPNFDNTVQEPLYLPSPYPNALTNPSTGIGYGMATSIIPHNPIELMNGAIKLLEKGDLTSKQLAKIIPGPDFPTGGVLIGENEIINEIETGKASYRVRGEIKTEPGKDDKHVTIVIDEIPYGASVERIMEKLTELFMDVPLGIDPDDVANESRKDIRITIPNVKPDQVDKIKALIYKRTELEMSISCTNNMIVNNRPQLVNIKTYLQKWTEFRKGVLKTELDYDYEKASKRLNIVEGLLKLLDMTDQIVKAAKASKNREDLNQTLQKKYKFNEEQAGYISGMPIYRLGKDSVKELQDEKKELTDEIKRIEDATATEAAFNKYVIADMKSTIKFMEKNENIDTERKTRFISEEDAELEDVDVRKIQQEDLPAEDAYVIVRKDGVVMRNTPRVYNNNIEDAKNDKPIIADLKAKTNDWVLLFTSGGGVIARLVNDLENSNPKYDVDSLHKAVNDFKADDYLVGAALWNSDIEKKDLQIVSVTEQGMMKASPLNGSMPNTNTKRYFSRLTQYNGMKFAKEGDVVGIVEVVTKKDLASKKEIQVESRERNFKLALNKASQQGPNGKGAKRFKGFNVNKMENYVIK